eukprot:6490174-Prymnesium_polylepis.2
MGWLARTVYAASTRHTPHLRGTRWLIAPPTLWCLQIQAATMSSVAAESQANVVRAHLAGHTPDGLWASVKKKFCVQGVTTTTREETVRLSRGESSDVVGVSSAAAKSMSAASRPKPKQVELQPGMLVSQHV